MKEISLGYPGWVIVAHWLNFLFMTLLMRSGVEILSNHPKLYWNDHCNAGSEWLRFTRRQFTDDVMFASTDEEEAFSPIIALPGRTNLGLGRYWHFAAVLGWLTVGVGYVAMLFVTDQWRRLLPTSWQIVPDAWHAMQAYLQLRPPHGGNSMDPLHPYNALQQLTYAAVVFVLAPLQIFTGLTMLPALTARFPWYPRLFGGHQAARSLHFLGLAAYAGFFVIHMIMVFWHGFTGEMSKMVLGEEQLTHPGLAVAVAVGIIGMVLLINVLATVASLRRPRLTQVLLKTLVDPVRTRLFHRLTARQSYHSASISHPHRMNGYPPVHEFPAAHDETGTYERLLQNNFANWHLEVYGLVRHPLRLSLADLRALRYESHVAKHVCIQGWTGFGKWGGVPLDVLLGLCEPLAEARYLAFFSFQKHEKAYYKLGRHDMCYYECIDLDVARQPESIIALDLNDEPLSLRHGAPARLRVETVLGFKMVKYLRAIEVIADVQSVGDGYGGCREDLLHYDSGAEI